MTAGVCLSMLGLLAACGSGERQAKPAVTTQQQSTTAPSTTSPDPSTSTTTVPNTTTTASTTTTTAPAPIKAIQLSPDRTVEVPSDWMVISVAGTDPMVVLAYRPSPDRDVGRPVLWRVGSDPATATAVHAALPDYAFAGIQRLLEFEGRFFAFAHGQWDQSGNSTGDPGMLVSTDGMVWSRATISAPAPGAVVRTGLTPDSPPSSDTAAVMGAAVHNGTLYATGWDLVDGTVAIMVWSSPDGDNWTARHIPPGRFNSEYGSRIAVGNVGMIIGLGGPVHTGVGALLSVVPGRFTSVEATIGIEEGFVGAAAPGRFGLAVMEFGYNLDPFALWTTPDGVDWTRTSAPAGVGDFSSSYGLVHNTSEPTLFQTRHEQRDVVVYRLGTEGWKALAVHGERVVAHDSQLVTSEPGLVRIYDLP